MKLGFDIESFEAMINPADTHHQALLDLISEMKTNNITMVITNLVDEKIQKFSASQKDDLTKVLNIVEKEIIQINDKSDMLAEDYLMYGLISRKNRINAQNIAAYAMANIPLYVTLQSNHLGRYLNRQRINQLNIKKTAGPIDLGSPKHALDVLLKPVYVQVVHKAQADVYIENTPTSIDDEKVKIRKKARKIIQKKS